MSTRTTTTADEVKRYAKDAIKDAAVLSLVGVSGLVAGRAIEVYELDTDANWLDLLDVMALEVYGTATVRATQQPVLESVTIVTGIGGPHVEFTVDHQDNVTGKAYWGSDRAERHENMPGLFDLLAEIIQP